MHLPKTWGASLCAVAVTALLSACQDDTMGPVETSTNAAAQANAAAAGQPRRGPANLDEEFSALAEQAPGFGGLFQDQDGATVVYLTDLARSEHTRGVVAQYLARNGLAGANIRIRKGDHDFRQLAQWRQKLDAATLGGMTLSDVDESQNRVLIGVQDAASAQGARAAFARLGIPASAVVVREISPARTENLQGYIRPVRGGIQIQAPGTCTLSYVAVEEHLWGVNHGGPRYAITNSHCTSSFAWDSDDRIGQPDIYNQIGTEYSDPPLFTNAQNSNCPSGWNCRHSDAAMFLLDSNSGTLSEWNAFAYSSGTTFTGTGYYEGYQNRYFGQTVTKVGRTTGTTSGAIVGTCANIPVDGRLMLCQDQAAYSSSGGDSGSPVSYRVGGAEYAMGIHWGRNNVGAIFSHWTYAWSEIANDVLARTGVQWQPELTYDVFN